MSDRNKKLYVFCDGRSNADGRSNEKKINITAFGMERITGHVSKLDPKVLDKLFFDYDHESLQRKSSRVGVLLVCDYFGLQNKKRQDVVIT